MGGMIYVLTRYDNERLNRQFFAAVLISLVFSAIAWEQIDETPPTILFGSTAQNSTHVYVTGGFRNNDKLGDPNIEYTHMGMIYELTHDNAETFQWNLIRASGEIPPRRHGACAALVNNRVYLFGGITQQGKDDHMVYILDLSTKIWSSAVGASTRGGIPSHRQRHGCISYSGSMYLMGGMLEVSLPGGSKTASDTWKFDTVNLQWSRIHETGPGSLGRHSFNSYLEGSTWKVIMGKRDGALVDTVYSFDFASSTWTEAGKIGSTLTRQGACGGLVGTKFVVYGGTPSNEGSLNYDVAVMETGTFTPEFTEARSVWDTMPFISPGPKAFSQGFVLKGRLYCQGGYSKSDFCVDEDVWAFNPVSRLWDLSSTTFYPIGRSGMSLIPVSSNKMITFGGLGCRKDPLNYNDVWMFDASTKSWEKLVSENKDTNQPLGRSSAMHAVIDGKLWLFGGERFGGLQDRDYWVFNLGTKSWSKISSVDNTPFAAASRNSLATVQQGKIIYIWGGKSSDSKADAGYVHVVDLAESGVQVSGFKPSGTAPVPRSSFSAFMLGGKYCIFGGGTQSSQNDMWCLDLVSQVWERIILTAQSPVLSLRSSAYAYQDRLFVTNGFDGTETLTQMWTFDPVPKAWTLIKTDDILPKFWSSAGAIVNNQLYVFGGGISFGFGNQMHTLDLAFCSGSVDASLAIGVHLMEDGSGAGRYMSKTSCLWKFGSATHVYVLASDFGSGDTTVIRYKDAQAKDQEHTLSGQLGSKVMISTPGGFTASFQSNDDGSVGQGFSMRVFVCPSGNVVIDPATEGCTCPMNTYRVASMECVSCPSGTYQSKTNQTFCLPTQLPELGYGKNEWKNESPAPHPRMSPYAAVVGTTGYVFGGFSQGLLEAERQYFSLDRIHTIESLDFHTWRENSGSGEIPTPRDGSCVVAIESQIFMIGGYDPTRMVLLSDIYVLNSNTLSWRLHSNQTVIPPRRDHGCVSLGGKIYIFGGQNARDYLGDLWEIDFATQTVSRVVLSGDVNLLSRTSFISFVHSNEIIIFGGSTTSGLSNNGISINLATKTLSNKGTPQSDYKICGSFEFCLLNRAFSSFSLWEGKLFIHGGATQAAGSPTFEAVSDIVTLDIATWKVESYIKHQTASPSKFPLLTPTPRYSGASLQIRHLSLLFGGSAQFKTTGFSCILSESWVWDNAERKWKDTSLDHYPNARKSPSMAAAGSDVFLFGGEICRESDIKVNDLWVYHTDNRTWELIHRESASNIYPVPRKNSVMEHYEGTLFLVGGDSNEPSIETWTFNLKTRTWVTLILRSPVGKPPLYANQPNQRKGISGTAIGEYLYLWGGRPSYTISNVESLCVFILNMKEKKVHGDYSFNTPAPSLRLGASAFPSSGKVCFYGGSTDTDPFVEDIWCYHPGTRNWNLMFGAGNGTYPTSKESNAGMSDGKLVVYGGAPTDAGAKTDSLFSYDPENNVWVYLDSTGDVRPKVSEHGSTVVSNRIFFFGGHSRQGYSDRLSSYEFGYCSQGKQLQGSISGSEFGDGSLEAMYEPNTMCTWTLNKANYIRFDSMELGAGDFVNVFNSINMQKSNIIAQFTESQGFTSPQKALHSNTGIVVVQMTSDTAQQSNGFKASFFGCPLNSYLDDKSSCVCNQRHYRRGDDCIKCNAGDQYDACIEDQESSTGLGPIIGGVVGGVCAIVLVAFFATKRHYAKLNENQDLQKLSHVEWNQIDIEKMLGSGPTFDVYEGSLRGSKIVAKKLKLQDLPKNLVVDFRQDIFLLTDLRHPNLLLYMGSCIKQPNQAILLEYVVRGSLYDLIHNPMMEIPAPQKITFMNDICKGLLFLHMSNPVIIHGNLTSYNVMVDERFNLKISDFLLHSIRHHMQDYEKAAPRNLLWCAPEVLKYGELSTSSDVFSFGIICWEILTLMEPYEGETMPISIAARIQNEGLRPRLEDEILGSSTPKEIKDMIRNCWLESVGDRPSFVDIASYLKPFADNASKSGSSFIGQKAKAPSGRVSLVFTDVQSSTHLWENAPEDMSFALNIHNEEIRACISRNEGYEVKTEGDAFMVAFQSTDHALNFCFDVQLSLLECSWPQAILTFDAASRVDEDDVVLFNGLRVRMGIHVGEPTCQEDPVNGRMDYFGRMVNRSARVEGFAKGGQIVVSEDVLQEIQSSEFPFRGGKPSVRDLGIHTLKGLTTPDHLYEVLPAVLKQRYTHFIESGSGSGSGSGSHGIVPVIPGPDSNSKAEAKEVSWEVDFTKLEITNRSLGSGSFGTVYLAKYKGVDVAVKKLLKQQAKDKAYFSLLSEITIMKDINHPNIVKFVAASLKPGNRMIVLEYMEKGNLADFLLSKEPMSSAQQWKVLRLVSDAMNYLHSRKPSILHRDLKSSNIMMATDFNVKLVDFGMSRVKAENQTMTRCGTAAWLAPEIYRGTRYNEKADVYSFGIVAWEVLARQKPFSDIPPLKLSGEVMNGARPSIPPGCDTVLVRLMQKCWDQVPDNRPSFADIHTQLQDGTRQ